MSAFACCPGEAACSIDTYGRRQPAKILQAKRRLMDHEEFANLKNKADASPSALVFRAE